MPSQFQSRYVYQPRHGALATPHARFAGYSPSSFGDYYNGVFSPKRPYAIPAYAATSGRGVNGFGRGTDFGSPRYFSDDARAPKSVDCFHQVNQQIAQYALKAIQAIYSKLPASIEQMIQNAIASEIGSQESATFQELYFALEDSNQSGFIAAMHQRFMNAMDSIGESASAIPLGTAGVSMVTSLIDSICQGLYTMLLDFLGTCGNVQAAPQPQAQATSIVAGSAVFAPKKLQALPINKTLIPLSVAKAAAAEGLVKTPAQLKKVCEAQGGTQVQRIDPQTKLPVYVCMPKSKTTAAGSAATIALVGAAALIAMKLAKG